MIPATNPGPHYVSVNEERPNGVTTIVRTVLAEKLDEAPWKGPMIARLPRRLVRLEFADRQEATVLEFGSGGVGLRNASAVLEDLAISLDMKQLSTLLSIPLAGRLPAVWRPGGKAFVRALVSRGIRVRGLLLHPLLALRILQFIGVPDSVAGVTR